MLAELARLSLVYKEPTMTTLFRQNWKSSAAFFGWIFRFQQFLCRQKFPKRIRQVWFGPVWSEIYLFANITGLAATTRDWMENHQISWPSCFGRNPRAWRIGTISVPTIIFPYLSCQFIWTNCDCFGRPRSGLARRPQANPSHAVRGEISLAQK